MSNESGPGMDFQVEQERNKEKLLIEEVYKLAANTLKNLYGITLTDTESIYLFREAGKAVEIDKAYLFELEEMKTKGVSEDSEEYKKINSHRPILHMETIEGWIEEYLGIEQPIGLDVGLTPIISVNTDKSPKGYRWVQEDPADQSRAYSEARAAMRSNRNKGLLSDYYQRDEKHTNETFKKILLARLDTRRTESGHSDIDFGEE